MAEILGLIAGLAIGFALRFILARRAACVARPRGQFVADLERRAMLDAQWSEHAEAHGESMQGSAVLTGPGLYVPASHS